MQTNNKPLFGTNNKVHEAFDDLVKNKVGSF